MSEHTEALTALVDEPVRTLCPDCPDGQVWTSKGPTGELCETCGGEAFVLISERANRMTAAAPDLLRALEILVAGSTTPTNGVTRAPSWEAVERAARAIAKARGKS